MPGSENSLKETGVDYASGVSNDCISCDQVERLELRAGSIFAPCKKSDCPNYNKPIPYKAFAELVPSAKISNDLLEYVRQKLAERKKREEKRFMRKIKHEKEEETETSVEVPQIIHPATEALATEPEKQQSLNNPLDEDMKEVNDSFETSFESIRKRLAKAKELKTNEEAEPRSGEKPGMKGWDQLIENYRKLLKSSEQELNSLNQKASGIKDKLDVTIKEVTSELPVKECELKVEKDLKEDASKIEKLQKEVDSLSKQLEECLPRKEKVMQLLERIQYCTQETEHMEGQGFIVS